MSESETQQATSSPEQVEQLRKQMLLAARLSAQMGRLDLPAELFLEALGTTIDQEPKDLPERTKNERLTEYFKYDINRRLNSASRRMFERDKTDLIPPHQLAVDALLDYQHDVMQASAAIVEAGLDPTEFQVTAFHEVAQRFESLAREIGMEAISDGKMSQIKLSKALGVAQLTVGRWVKERKEGKK